jgi:hypothetical protein
LGGGAFGDVYKARKQSIGKAYAIKFLKIEDDGQREAVQRELGQVRHFAAIDHPNLVTIEDMGTVMDVPYLIMGYAGEDTLSRRLKSGKLERDDALLYFTQACRGVLALHDRRLVHFDLKPSNIFLKGDVARVGDYGLSKLLTDGRMTLSFGRGTPQYMAPEILRSRADHRADIYSLGVILYESLTGELPFQPNAEAGLVIREDDIPPEFPEDFPAFVRPVVEGCLRLAADDRFQEVGELLEGMGQTARQGDSVRVDWSADAVPRPTRPSSASPAAGPAASPASGAQGGAPGGADAVTTGGSSTVPGTEAPTSSTDLRHTAADLARGAVEVARGVWDGLRAGSGAQVSVGEEPEAQDGETGATTEGAGSAIQKESKKGRGTRRFRRKRKGKGTEGDVQRAAEEVKRAKGEVQDGLREVSRALRDTTRRLKGGRENASKRARGLVVVLGGGKDDNGKPAAATAMGSRPPTRAAGGTVPVPPRVEGGLLGTLWSSAVVGAEVLVALLGNLLKGIVRTFHFLTESLLRRSGGVIVRAARLLLFLGLMAVLGFTVMMVGMVFLDAVGVNP